MSPEGIPRRHTLLDALADSFAASLRSPEGVAEPVALLWTDADGQWLPLIPALQAAIPELYVLGAYKPEERTGPVIWLRCIVDRTLPEVSPPAGVTPIVYLPNVGRQQLRAGGDCPPALQPLIELLYRGAVWHQRNGRDWTVEAFLTSVDALGLDMAQDMRTKEAMLRVLPLLAQVPLAGLHGHRLEADDFDKLAVGDSVRDLLSWLGDAAGYRQHCDGARWETFRSVCKNEFGLDPDLKTPTNAGEALLTGGGPWDKVWQRYSEAPQLYPGVAGVLRDATANDLTAEPARQPAVNAEQEQQLRDALEAVAKLPHDKACGRVLSLEAQHGMRRGWVWAQLGESPLAMLLEALSRLAQRAATPLGGTDIEAVSIAYATDGWRCDGAAMEALARATSTTHMALVTGVLRAVYKPWLEESALNFQALAAKSPGVMRKAATGVKQQAETCILFADGLRFDVAGLLQETLEARGYRVRMSHRLAPVPTVTPTAKPMATPAHGACEDAEEYGEFAPILGGPKKPSSARRLREEMARQDIALLEATEEAAPSEGKQGGWTEFGELDAKGHSLNAGLAKQIAGEVETLADRVAGLLGGGWMRVRVVTDHGWLLLPGGLPKVELPSYLAETKWSRCAVVQGAVPPGMPVFPWHWNPQVQVVSPPGIGVFFAGNDYAHGGVSPQECVVPEMLVERGVETVRARIQGVSWRGMRCRVAVETNAAGLRVDLRLKPRQEDTSIVVAAKELDGSGQASMAVDDDRHEGVTAMVVLLDGSGQILDQTPTTVGEET